jgi:hypothetical protein
LAGANWSATIGKDQTNYLNNENITGNVDLLVARPTLHQMGGADRIAVWVCDVPVDSVNPGYTFFGSPTRLAIDPQAVASWAQQTAGIYFDGESNGRYEPTFVAMGRIPLSTSDGPADCLGKAQQSSGRPFTNVLVTDTSLRGDGFGQSLRRVGFVRESQSPRDGSRVRQS